MQPIIGQIKEAAIGCWMLVRGQDAGREHFDLSIDGFWRSFGLAIVLAVADTLDALIGHFQPSPGDEVSPQGSTVVLILVSATASLVTFCVFPVVVAALAKPMGLSQRYAPYIIARNWLTLFMSLPVYSIDVLTALDVLPDELRAPLVVVVVIATLFAGTQIAYRLLTPSRSLAFGFALCDFLLALLIGEAASQLLS